MLLQIAVIADTHNKFPASLVRAILNANQVWHLGDVCNPEILAPLRERQNLPVHVIRGNNDNWPEWPAELWFEFGQTRFLLVHQLPRKKQNADVVLFGHTHVPCCVKEGETLLLNPGTIGKPNKGHAPAWAWMFLDSETGDFTWVPMPL